MKFNNFANSDIFTLKLDTVLTNVIPKFQSTIKERTDNSMLNFMCFSFHQNFHLVYFLIIVLL